MTINENFPLYNLGTSNAFDCIELPRHRWYHYKEGYSPNIVESAIERCDLDKGDLILDPFNGSGTTTLTASTLGFNSIGIEVNPFTSFLSKTKLINSNPSLLISSKDRILRAINRGAKSPLIGFSTFSQAPELKKWLFNQSVLESFEGGWKEINRINDSKQQKIFQLVLISAAMQNCNGRKDGKCLRYKSNWENLNYNKDTFIASFLEKFNDIIEDIGNHPIKIKSRILNQDVRSILSNKKIVKFKLCITSPPYLNTFDYTDIYRPELFLGKFVKDNTELYNLRLKTLRSHIQAKWNAPTRNDFGYLYNDIISQVNERSADLMDKKIPLMIQAYFEDISFILEKLHKNAAKDANVWFVVSNSAFADLEIPVDLIIGEIGSKLGWYLKEIGVLRYIRKRKTKYSPEIDHLRESVVIFTKNK